MKHHTLSLDSRPFEAIAMGKKTIESRLFDEKRRRIQLGDTISFSRRDNDTQTLVVKVIGLLRYASFNDMFSRNNPAKFGGSSSTELLGQIRQFYTTEDEQKYGVIGIEFKLCKPS